jgi:hypothetical protein
MGHKTLYCHLRALILGIVHAKHNKRGSTHGIVDSMCRQVDRPTVATLALTLGTIYKLFLNSLITVN